MDRLYYRKSQRITSDKDFARVLAHKRVIRRGPLRLYAAQNQLDKARFAVSVSKSCGKAIERNRLKRVAREAFRKNQAAIEKGFDYIMIFSQPKSSAKEAKQSLTMSYKEMEKRLLEMISAVANSARE